MLFGTRGRRSLRQRVLRWAEETTHAAWNWLYSRRRECERERFREQRHKPYYDTFRSWVDEAKVAGNGYFRLFMSPAKFDQPEVSNFDGSGAFPCDDAFRLLGMRAEVLASDPDLRERVCAGTRVELNIASREMISLVLSDLVQQFLRLERALTIPERQNFFVNLEFSPEIGKLLQELKTRVGPGAGWVLIRVTLDGVLIRTVL